MYSQESQKKTANRHNLIISQVSLTCRTLRSTRATKATSPSSSSSERNSLRWCWPSCSGFTWSFCFSWLWPREKEASQRLPRLSQTTPRSQPSLFLVKTKNDRNLEKDSRRSIRSSRCLRRGLLFRFQQNPTRKKKMVCRSPMK